MSRPQAKSYKKKAVAKVHHGYGHGRPPERWLSKVMDGFRKMIVGLFPFPPKPSTMTFPVDVDRSTCGRGGGGVGDHALKRSSCSLNLQPVNAHYDEAIANWVEFFHKSAQADVRSRPHF